MVGPTDEPGLSHWMFRTSQSQCGTSVSDFGCPAITGDLLLGCRVPVIADRDRGVPVAVGEVAVSLQG